MDSIDYQEAKFKFEGVRKHFFKDVTYHITVFEDMVTMGTTSDCQNPKYKLKLNLETKINWELRKNKKELDYFEFDHQNKRKVVHAQPDDLSKFKELLSGRVTFEGIGDLYQPLFQIGKGSSAKVYSARSALDQRVYAVKAIEKAFLKISENANGLRAFQSEVQILRALQQYENNFLVFKEIYEGDNTLYVVTSYLEGLSLSEELDKAKTLPNRRLPINNVRTIMRKLLGNLKILHSHRIIHRDLKPDNLMFSRKNDYTSLVLVDFGLATSELLDKYLFPKCGTPGYVAPEVLSSRSDQRYNCKVDIFSAGCIFYKLLTGHSLFMGSNFDEVLNSNKTCYVDLDLPMDGIYITEQSLDILKKMLNKNPKIRVSAAQALSHQFFDSNSDFSTQAIQSGGLHITKNAIYQLNLAESESKYNSENEINDEQQQNSKINDLKRYSLMNEIPLSAKRGSAQFSGTFYQKDPLSAIKSLKIPVETSQPLKLSCHFSPA
ncbi:unnamed protein product (macronuclear) [Paramecium tetraurelia]|uniref:Protein kinase domain-containing protein n=1 Tax=Paramecium tetraurelia TaxID=5888 RepID=A0CPR7_PARTE|nr:uncharacterized protein GSPATT00009176001 [Paramecium tetraurelia]CAK72784.1 unnamed protein product [Paramecium tetraurelia]|eukprot:XP_001440181.1 hypothetical protein (macronuclear) [Paramecium tetraurelia strain d4-2]